MDLIITTPDKLTQVVSEAVAKALDKTHPSNSVQIPDRILIDEATIELGLPKSSIYKLTMEGKIPFSKFGNKLIFSRRDLKVWLHNNTIPEISIKNQVGENLMKQAKKKGRVSK